MTDHLTQLQDCFDQLAMQMFASLRYVQEHHPRPPLDARHSAVPPAPQVNGMHQTNGTTHDAKDDDEEAEDHGLRTETPEAFTAALNEIAKDLVAKEQQIESLVQELPGRDRTVQEQEEHVLRLNQELKDMDIELERAAKEKEYLLKRVEDVIWKVSRY